jgi:hypothetical protein
MNPELALTLAHLKFPESKNSKKKKKIFFEVIERLEFSFSSESSLS